MLSKRPFYLLPLVLVSLSACSSGGSALPDAMQESSTTTLHVHNHGSGDASLQSGLTSEAQGVSLVLDSSSYKSSPVEIKFTIEESMSTPYVLSDYELHHTMPLHLVVVKHDLSEYYHVHPTFIDGTWRTEPLDLSDGFYRVIANFQVKDKDQLALGTDIMVGSSPMAMVNFDQESRVSVVDGYTITSTGSTKHESDAILSFLITKEGSPVSAVESYLEASGHLVAINPDTMAYTHLHPNTGVLDGVITFKASPTEHGYSKYFLEVKLDGKVRLFTFVLEGM
jgi:hypothetical protein